MRYQTVEVQAKRRFLFLYGVSASRFFPMDGILLEFFKATVLLFAIMDPFASIPVFLAVTQKMKESEKTSSANYAAMVAGVLILVFLFFGKDLLNGMRITLEDFKIAGGIILLIMGAQILFGTRPKRKAESYHAAAVIIGTPLITGPGVITTTIILTQEVGVMITLAAAMLSLFLTWLMLRFSGRIQKFLGNQFVLIFSKVMGMLLMAVGISFIRGGVMTLIGMIGK